MLRNGDHKTSIGPARSDEVESEGIHKMIEFNVRYTNGSDILGQPQAKAQKEREMV